MSDLEKILNDDLLKCEIVGSVENAARRVDLIKWTHDNTYSIAEGFSFEFPVTRGFSDVPDRRDVDISSDLDIVCAIDEYIAEREGKQKVYPWMLKQVMSADDLGVTEE